MYLIQIRILGPVAFRRNMNSEVGCRYDVPVDSLDIPYIPPYEIIADTEGALSGVKIGFAHPDGYPGQIMAALPLKNHITFCSQYIRGCFLDTKYDSHNGYSVRALKPGQVFLAHFSCGDEDRKRIARILERIVRIGVTAPEDGITGEVEVRLVDSENRVYEKPVLHDGLRYASLTLDILPVSPLCFYSPFSDKAKTELFVPGAVIRENLMKRIGRCPEIDWDQLICSNAYPSAGNERLLPTPVCVSVVKLDREQMRYRLAPGKNPLITEQDVGLDGTFAADIQEHLMRYMTPETKQYVSKSGQTYEAMTEGQSFRGTICGQDSAIRRIAEFVSRYPAAHIGTLSDEGFGEAYFRISAVKEEKIPAENLSRCFDVCCVSDTLILNGRGVPTCRAEDLLAEIEHVLGVSGKLRITGRYTSVQEDYSWNPLWQEDRSVERCFGKGSILRLEAVGGPVDISPLSHCFIGERTEDGYGELMAFPARGGYYRRADKMIPNLYETPMPVTCRDFIFGAQLTDQVINGMIKSRVRNIGVQDRGDLKMGISPEDLLPLELLLMIRDMYNPALKEEQLIQWYQDGLTGGSDHEPD